jgi:hypothetical protein
VAGLVQALLVPPVDPRRSGQLELLHRFPGPSSVDQLGLVEAVDRIGQCVVEGIALGSDRGHGLLVGQTLGVANGQILNPAIGMMDQLGQVLAVASADGHLERVEGQIGAQGLRHSPSDDAPGEGIGDEAGVAKACPGPYVGDVREPQAVGGVGEELTIDQVGRTSREVAWDGGALGLAPTDISIGLVLFGAIDATLPHSTRTDFGPARVGSNETPVSVIATASTPVVSGQDGATQRVAEEFITATGTTDATHPEANTVERAALAPALVVPAQATWPEAWVAEDRRTMAVLDPAGPVVAVGPGQVAVVVTGRTVVTTDADQSSEVPADERVRLRLIGPMGTANASEWVVTDVGPGW